MEEKILSCIEKMRPPSAMSIIDIDITNKCDLACSNCTRLLENQGSIWEMSIENFRLAVRSLSDFPGIVAIIGGNPCMHSRFPEICEIFKEEFPDKSRRGLWTNNLFKHHVVALDTFGTGNFNAHGVARGIKSLSRFYKALGKRGDLRHGHSTHAPLLTAVKDLYSENEMWDKISSCEINRGWSASVVQYNGALRAYFCEVAAAFDLAIGGDLGVEVTPSWWQRPLRDFYGQISNLCPRCGVPAKIRGSLDSEEVDTFTLSNLDLVERSLVKGRKVIYISKDMPIGKLHHSVTDYNVTQRDGYSFVGRFKNWVRRLSV